MTATLDHIQPATFDDYYGADYGHGAERLSPALAPPAPSRNDVPNFCDTVGCADRCTDANGNHYPEGATKPLGYNVDVAMELLDTVETALRAPYLTTGDDSPTPEEVEALGKARRLLSRAIAQLDRAYGGEGMGIPDEDVPEVDYR